MTVLTPEQLREKVEEWYKIVGDELNKNDNSIQSLSYLHQYTKGLEQFAKGLLNARRKEENVI